MNTLVEFCDLCIEGRLPNGRWKTVVSDINFQVECGEVVGLIGESGAGKSTIALSALAYTRPGCRISRGAIVFDGVNVLSLSLEEKRKLRGRRIAYIAQSAQSAFNPALSIVNQITEAPLVHGLTDFTQALNKSNALASRIRLPELCIHRPQYSHQFSGGQLQRLMAVMAMSCEPDLVVFDEPTTAIDVTTQVEVLKAFKHITRQVGKAAIYVTHDLAVVSQIADKIIVLRDGRIVEMGPTAEIVGSPKEMYTKKLMAAVRSAPGPSSDLLCDRTAEIRSPVITVDHLEAGYGLSRGRSIGSQILFDIELTIPRGQTVGVIGESGCGKSTLVRVIAGLLPAFRGRILLEGREMPVDVSRRTKEDLRRIQLVTQNPDASFNPRSRVKDVLERPLQFYYSMKRKACHDRAMQLLEMVGLSSEYMDSYPQQLSGGEKQRLSLARALTAEPDVVLCDEVTSALDTVVSAEIIRLLKSLQHQLHTAFVFISHDVSTVASIADRIVVLYAGRVVENGPTGHVLSPPYHPYTRLLLGSVPELRIGWLETYQALAEVENATFAAVDLRQSGCPFHTRCPMAIKDTCDRLAPPTLRPAPTHLITCHRTVPDLESSAGNLG